MKKKWSYENCYREAMRYSAVESYRKNSPSSYKAAVRYGWFHDYTWLEGMRKKNGYWDEQHCYEEALKHKSAKSMQKSCSAAYNAAYKNGWLTQYTWFEHKTLPQNYWTHDNCRTAALLCKTRSEFKNRFPSAYNKSLENGWLDEWKWLPQTTKKRGYWNEDTCRNAALLCETRTQYSKLFHQGYNVAKKNGWLDGYTWLKDERIDIFEGKIDLIYVYEFVDEKTAYVGRTLMKRYEDRDWEHIFMKNDCLHRFAESNNMPVPPMKILEANLTLKESTIKEGEWLEYYEHKGWKMLNKAKTGGIGSLGYKKSKYSYDICYQIAKTCASMSEFIKKSTRGYEIAKQNDWLKDYVWFKPKVKPNGYWGYYQNCYNAALLCKTRTEFNDRYSGAYNTARKNGWIDDYTWFKTKHESYSEANTIYTEEFCRSIAEQYEYLHDFIINKKNVYQISCKHGWLKNYTWLKQNKPKEKPVWTFEKCREIALRYDTLLTLRKNNKKCYDFSLKYGYLKEFTWLKRQRKPRTKKEQGGSNKHDNL